MIGEQEQITEKYSPEVLNLLSLLFSRYLLIMAREATAKTTRGVRAGLSLTYSLNTDGTMESNTKSAFAENHLFETSDNIVQKR